MKNFFILIIFTIFISFFIYDKAFASSQQNTLITPNTCISNCISGDPGGGSTEFTSGYFSLSYGIHTYSDYVHWNLFSGDTYDNVDKYYFSAQAQGLYHIHVVSKNFGSYSIEPLEMYIHNSYINYFDFGNLKVYDMYLTQGESFEVDIIYNSSLTGATSYDLSIEVNDDNNINNPETLTSPNTIQEKIDYIGDIDYFTFTTVPNQAISFSASSTTLAPKLTILDTNHNIILSEIGNIDMFGSENSGSYILEISSYESNDIGLYSLNTHVYNYTDQNTSINPQNISPGITKFSSIDYLTDADYYTFTEEFPVYDIYITDTYLNLSIQIINKTDNSILGNYSNGELIENSKVTQIQLSESNFKFGIRVQLDLQNYKRNNSYEIKITSPQYMLGSYSLHMKVYNGTYEYNNTNQLNYSIQDLTNKNYKAAIWRNNITDQPSIIVNSFLNNGNYIADNNLENVVFPTSYFYIWDKSLIEVLKGYIDVFYDNYDKIKNEDGKPSVTYEIDPTSTYLTLILTIAFPASDSIIFSVIVAEGENYLIGFASNLMHLLDNDNVNQLSQLRECLHFASSDGYPDTYVVKFKAHYNSFYSYYNLNELDIDLTESFDEGIIYNQPLLDNLHPNINSYINYCQPNTNTCSNFLGTITLIDDSSQATNLIINYFQNEGLL